MAGLTQDFAGLIEPDDEDWDRASPALRRRYYEAAGPIMLDELAKQLGRGIGSNGRAMKARIQPVLDDGADGPVMEPHYSSSRVITLADWSATDSNLKLFWHAGTGHASHRKAREIGKRPRRSARSWPGMLPARCHAARCATCGYAPRESPT